jgi:hypothetical protein
MAFGPQLERIGVAEGCDIGCALNRTSCAPSRAVPSRRMGQKGSTRSVIF